MTQTQKFTAEEISIIRTALPAVEAAANSSQNECWPGDGPVHDDNCTLINHDLSRRAVEATKGLVWEFDSWSSTATWMRKALAAREQLYTAAGQPEEIDIAIYGTMPENAIALKYADDIDDARWITDLDDAAAMWREDAPLVWTVAGAKAMSEDKGLHVGAVADLG